MKKNLNPLRPLSAAVCKTLDLAEAAREALEEKMDGLFEDAQRAVAPHRLQPGNTTLIVHRSSNINTSFELALLGSFEDFHGLGRNASYVSLRNDVCGCELNSEDLDGWLTPEAKGIVSNLGSRSDRLAAEMAELQKLLVNLEEAKDRLEGWERRVEDRLDGFDPDKL